jgi:hypothetical protein
MTILLIKSPSTSGSQIVDPLILASFQFDVTTEETESRSTDWTSNPVENGLDVSDNAVVKPINLSLSGVISDTPLNSVLVPLPNTAKDAYDTLIRLQESRSLVTVVTGLEVYPNMGIVSVDSSRNSKTGQTLRPKVKLRQVRLVTSVEIAIPPELLKPKVSASAQSGIDAGKQPTTDIPYDGDEVTASITEETEAMDIFNDKSAAATLLDKWGK